MTDGGTSAVAMILVMLRFEVEIGPRRRLEPPARLGWFLRLR
jgi:hypothetical protein